MFWADVQEDYSYAQSKSTKNSMELCRIGYKIHVALYRVKKSGSQQHD